MSNPSMEQIRAANVGIWTCPAEPTNDKPDPRFIPVTAYGEATRPKVKSEYKREMQTKLAKIRRDHYHGSMSSDTYALYRFAFLMSESEAHSWRPW